MANLKNLSDEELDALAMERQEARAEAEAGFKAELKEIGAERDKRMLATRIAELPDEVIVAIRSAKPAKQEA